MSNASKGKPVLWRQVPSVPDYEVSEYGDVRRCTRGRTRKSGHVLSGHCNKKGYRHYKLMLPDGSKGTRSAHALALEAFVGPRPTHKHQVAHWDGNPRNNHISNLRWATGKENLSDRKRHCTELRGQRNGRAKLTEADVAEIRRLYERAPKKYGLHSKLARAYGVTWASMRDIISGTHWSHVR